MTVLMHARDALDGCRVLAISPTAVGRLTSVRGPFMVARGFVGPIGTGALVDGAITAEIVGFDRDDAILMTLAGAGAPVAGAAVVATRSSCAAGVGDVLLGRVIDGLGKPIDGQGPIIPAAVRDVRGTVGNPLDRRSVDTMFSTGIRAIDAFTTFGCGQRVILAAGSGVGKSTLIRQIIDGAQADVIVVALIGERNREIVDFVTAMRGKTAAASTVTVAVPGDRSPLLRIRAVQRATAIAEHFRDAGKAVLLIVDSLTRVAHAQRELGLGTGETIALKGYPPSALAIIPALLERCGNDGVSGGSITAIYTVLAEGDDVDDPVVDAARAIADGHIILSRALAEQGVFPAIDIGCSLSRVMNDIVTPAHKRAAANVRRLWAIAEENRDLLLMGAYQPGADPTVDAALAARPEILDFVAQSDDLHVDPAAMIAGLVDRFGV